MATSSTGSTNNDEQRKDDDTLANELSFDFSEYDEEERNSPSKKRNLDSFKPEQVHLSTNYCYFKIVAVAGGFELISCEINDKNDGFLQPIRDKISKKNSTLRMKWKIIAYGNRRVSPTSDEILRNSISSTPKQGFEAVHYPRLYFIRRVNVSTVQSRQDILNYLCEFMASFNLKNPYGSPLRANKRRAVSTIFMLKPDYDMTPKRNLNKMSYYITTQCTVNFISLEYTDVTSTWARENPLRAAAFFDKPYPLQACNTLGYKNET